LTIRGPQDAVDAGLVDGLRYEDELVALLEEKLDGDEASMISLGEYTLAERFLGGMDLLTAALEERNDDEEGEDVDELGGNVAVIYAVGAIESGEGDASTIGSETIAAALKEAREADDVEAVVLRVNSPGGSALASDVIWRETVLLKETGKPFVVSMSNLAASGGYYISCAADRIFANETTITGSIGVFGMIPNLGGMLKKHVGVTFDEVALHDHAGQPDGLFAPDAVALAAINESVSDIYDAFTQRVSEGRGLSRERVEELARGRVWTGSDALENGLVDEIGDLEQAVAHAAQLADIAEDDVRRVALPEAQDPFQALVEDLTGVKAGLQTLGFTGVEEEVLQELWQVRRMVETGDPIQARLPYTLRIK
jgi:protease-4